MCSSKSSTYARWQRTREIYSRRSSLTIGISMRIAPARHISLYNNPDVLQLMQKRHMKDSFHDSLGFITAKMIRRTGGLAHVEDFESSSNPGKRAARKKKAFDFTKLLLKNVQSFRQIGELVTAILQLINDHSNSIAGGFGTTRQSRTTIV
ncbi:hypothetical protein MLD38_032121 [Melastoma candidum]|uniref:Uncharacterized protein n=1 Tax=Melastoma candidum TaxID=119954 RepID=A0ACB9M2V6_9MYRT|nr:hypothetical protein MLD38_032121 [Melastoma candidum]